jgi:hypothetical protein
MCRLCILPFILTMLCFIGCKKEDRGLIGVWQIREVARQSDGALITDKPLPSIFIFTPGHYSMLWVFSTKTEPFVERWNPTDEERIKRFNSLIINSGTYEIEGSTITMYPVVARIPDLMGGKQIGEYHIENDTMQLKLVDEYSFDGVQAPWVAGGGITLTLVRIE